MDRRTSASAAEFGEALSRLGRFVYATLGHRLVTHTIRNRTGRGDWGFEWAGGRVLRSPASSVISQNEGDAMGLMDKLRGEFVDIVEWLDDSRDTIVWRFSRYQNEIKMGAQLVVRESQTAVFVNEGQIADAFGPGTYTLETRNLPVLATLKGWKYGFNSPFKAQCHVA
ncbi:SPFH domain-containing protein [Micromonospora sp. WMMA1363]|uniref:SPFH domain-containing protein n=1 Tax=Micromonospora sp. WMMA1363 TaxID=3053985 RepID=UPI00259C6EA2|nr:SPFH domain-containing protein [Micromonospora sp. WMMA1363]MDM4719389.1 SPFH domain-containing protein [Micromonospora sp. WMMA1363]